MSSRGTRTATVGSGRVREGGALVTAKQDFNAHWQGNSFQHGAPDVLMEPTLPFFSSSNLQGTLEEMLVLVTSGGSGFISIGSVDGYSTDGYSSGSYNVGAVETPTLYDAFVAAFADSRLQGGGIVLVMAGTYTLDNTVEVPAGISIMGENSGTIINGEMFEEPMFKILRGSTSTIGGNEGAGEINLISGAPKKGCKLFNLILVDNLNGVIQSGGEPIASMSTVPMVQCERSSHLTCDYVRFIGRVNNGAVSARTKTLKAVGYTTGGSTGSTLVLENCYFDGLKIGFDFTPGNGDIDFLTVNRCRARTFGSESDPGDTSYASNCFGLLSLCNATLTNNYHTGAASSIPTVRAMFVINTATGATTDVKMVLTGNSGGPTLSSANSNNLLVDTTSTSIIRTVKTGNSWGGSIQNDWFVIVGSAAGGAVSGDILGTGAIDFLIGTLASYVPTTVIVNPGTYVITSLGGGNSAQYINFVGNKRRETYPVFSFNLPSGTDALGSRVFKVAGLKSLRLKCYTATTSNYHHVEIPAVGHITTVEDCIFSNVGLTTAASSPANQDGDPVKTSTVVRNCHFFQDGDYADNISLFLISTDTVRLEDCIFRNCGYIGGIGEVSGLSLTSSASVPEITIKNCFFSLKSGTIDDASPITSFNSWFFIQDSAAKISIENCQFSVDDVLGAATPVNTTLTSAGTYTKHIHLLARDITISNTVFNGPEQTFATGGQTYALPTLYVEPQQSLKIMDCRFVGGGLPLQISGANSFSSANLRGGIGIYNSEFCPASGSTQITDTLLDIDIDLNSFTTASEINPQVVIQGCNFWQRIATTTTQVQHTEMNSANYTGQGIVQIYAPFFDVNFSDNKVTGNLRLYNTLGNPYSHFAGVLINNYDGKTIASTASASPFFVSATNNKIRVRNYWAPENSSTSVACLWIKSSSIQVCDNALHMNNTIGGTLGFCGPLYINNIPTSGTPYSEGIVTGNFFSRRDDVGATSALRVAYVNIASTSGRGMLTDNSFCSRTIDGSGETFVNDATSEPDKWLMDRNKNQIFNVVLSGSHGLVGNQESAIELPVAAGAENTDLSIVVLNSPGFGVEILYPGGSTTGSFFWLIPLYGLLPDNARIISATATANSSEVMTAGTFSFTLSGNGLTTVTGTPVIEFETPYTPSDDISSVCTPTNTTPTTTYVNRSDMSLVLQLISNNIQDSNTSNIFIDGITLKYTF